MHARHKVVAPALACSNTSLLFLKHTSSSSYSTMSAEDTQGVVPYILSSDGDKHIEWMKNVLGGVEKFTFRFEDKGKVAHAAIAINGGCLYLTDVADEKAVKAVNDISIAIDNGESATNGDGENQSGPSGFILQMEVEDPNVIWKKAMSSGCTVEMDLKEQYWGCMYGIFKDPFGFPWALAKAKEENRKRGVIPYLLTPEGECEKHVEWLKTAYGGEVKEKYCSDDGSKILHCDVELNGYHVYLADQTERELESLNRKPHLFHCHLSVADPKAMWETAMKNDAKTIVDMKVQFWGGLQGTLQDKFGFRWSLSPPSPSTKSDSTNSPGVVAYLLSPDCEQHIEFIKNVFDGKVKSLYHTNDQKVMHCSMNVNGGELCLADQLCTGENKEWPKRGEACGFMCHLDLSDPDATWKKAMENGATQVVELKMQFWGDYYGIFKDPLGYGWALRKEE